MDHFSKWPEAEAIPDKTVKSVALFLYNMFCRLDLMHIPLFEVSNSDYTITITSITRPVVCGVILIAVAALASVSVTHVLFILL
jgi:hypothetical protein